MSAVKYSRQRQSIKEYLAGTKEHPTADMVYTGVRKLYPKISLGTVYRNLNFLVEQGEAVRLTCGDGSERYDGDTAPHYHLRCRGCGGIFDLPMDSLEHINTLAAAHYEGVIEGHSVLFYGKCPECAHGGNSFQPAAPTAEGRPECAYGGNTSGAGIKLSQTCAEYTDGGSIVPEGGNPSSRKEERRGGEGTSVKKKI